MGAKVVEDAPVVASNAKMLVRLRVAPTDRRAVTVENLPTATIVLPTLAIDVTAPWLTLGVLLDGLADTMSS